MGVTVRGVLDGVGYEVNLTGRRGDPVTGSARVVALVERAAGERVLAGPTGPLVTVRGDDPRSIVLLLSKKGQVDDVTGLPEPAPPTRPGVIQ